IYGTVFDDLNGNGLQDPIEPGLAGVVISATVGGETGVVTATTRSYGQFTYGFEVARPGIHTISEQDPALPDYRSTTPDAINLDVSLGQSYIVNFGDTASQEFSPIMGIVFHDGDGSGTRDPSELGIEGVDIALSNGLAATTGSYGEYTFALWDTGYYQVSETDPPGYHSTTPNIVTVPVDDLGQLYVVNFGDSDDGSGTSFFGTVFEDLDVDGTRDGDEPGLAGVAVELTGPAEGLPVTHVTNEWGQYTFPLEQTGVFTVTETDPDGYVSTAAIPAHPSVIAVDANALRAELSSLGIDLGDNLFGDVQASQMVIISGSVWEDNGAAGGIPADGVWDGGEPGLAGAVVSLSTGLSQATGVDGSFLLYAPANQPITVTETNPEGYLSTGALAGDSAIVLGDDRLQVAPLDGGSVSDGNLFADVLPADLSVLKAGNPDPVAAGGILTYTLSYANESMQLSGEVTITDTLGDGMVFGGLVSQPAGWGGPSYDPGPPATLTWYTPTLAGGAAGSMIFTVTVTEEVAYGVLLTNRAEITGTVPESRVGNNAYIETTRAGCFCPADRYEDDDDVSRAVRLAVGAVQTHDFCDDPGDWVWFSAEAGQAITLTTSSWGRRADTFLALYDTNGSTLLVANDDYEGSTDFSSRIVWQAPADGIYFVEVSNRAGLTGCLTDYDLWLEVPASTEYWLYLPLVVRNVSLAPAVAADAVAEPRGVIEHGCPDRYEVDDTWQEARPLELGVVQAHSFDSNPYLYAADKDFVWLDLAAGDRVKVSVTTLTNTLTLLELYDVQGNALNLTGETELSWEAAEDGRYIVSIRPLTLDFGCVTEVGYKIVAERPQQWIMYLPLTLRNH
ncbi:MAG: SdrD B-like domain-containing protein, partial [Anaerolineae bacterium]